MRKTTIFLLFFVFVLIFLYAIFKFNSEKISFWLEIRNCQKLKEIKERDLCFSKLASKYKDPKFCSKLGEKVNQDVCYWILAERTLNPQLCDKISTEYEKSYCLAGVANIKNDFSICNTSSQKISDNCYYTLAQMGKKEEICDNIKDEFLKKDCKGNLKIDKKL
jgi:hypothetical protein